MTEEKKHISKAARIIGQIRAELFSYSQDHPEGFGIIGESAKDGSFKMATTMLDGPRFEITGNGAVKLNGRTQESAAAALKTAEKQIDAHARKHLALRGKRKPQP